MKIYKPGTLVKLIIGNIEGMIIGVAMTQLEIEYRIRYIENGKPESVWVWSYEIELPSKKPMGFSNGSTTETIDNTATLLID